MDLKTTCQIIKDRLNEEQTGLHAVVTLPLFYRIVVTRLSHPWQSLVLCPFVSMMDDEEDDIFILTQLFPDSLDQPLTTLFTLENYYTEILQLLNNYHKPFLVQIRKSQSCRIQKMKKKKMLEELIVFTGDPRRFSTFLEKGGIIYDW
jgi:hypothetical protein